ncbi:MAG TPA: DUF937 domain-containing protein [Woeseiaceae bacterium]|nr:DUF937 domain-containing protein [Woeseiaceae bacterium]
MNLMELLEQEGGGSSVAKLAGQLGIDERKARQLIGSVSPAVAGGLQKRAQSTEGQSELAREIESGKYQRYVDDPQRLEEASAREEGNHALSQLFGSEDDSRQVAARASEETGLEKSLIEKALPLVAGLAMGALGKKSKEQGGLGGGLGSLAGILGGSDGKFGVEDVKNIGGKFF